MSWSAPPRSGMNACGIMIKETEGLVEVVAEKRYGEVLGVHYIGRAASEMAGQGILAIELEATLEDPGKGVLSSSHPERIACGSREERIRKAHLSPIES